MVAGLGKGSVVGIVVNRCYFFPLVYRLQNLDILPIEEVEFAAQLLDTFGQLSQTLDHELDAVVREIRVFFGVDLYRSENEDGGDLFMLF
jgi:hypothetical protein